MLLQTPARHVVVASPDEAVRRRLAQALSGPDAVVRVVGSRRELLYVLWAAEQGVGDAPDAVVIGGEGALEPVSEQLGELRHGHRAPSIVVALLDGEPAPAAADELGAHLATSEAELRRLVLGEV